MILLNLDDFAPSQEENALNYLVEFKDKYPDFKVTLFTIYGKWRRDMLKGLRICFADWLDLAAHGFTHYSNDECEKWSLEQWHRIIDNYENGKCFTKLFKAPNWQMSSLGYEVLKERGWAVAVRESQIKDVPKGMKYYSFEEQGGVHGHTWLMKSHIESGMFKDWNKDSGFDFISNHLKIKE